jgi:hypothetical protein
MLVSGIVVDDEMDRKIFGYDLIVSVRRRPLDGAVEYVIRCPPVVLVDA